MKKDSEDLFLHRSSGHLNSTSIIDDVDLGFVSMEDLGCGSVLSIMSQARMGRGESIC